MVRGSRIEFLGGAGGVGSKVAGCHGSSFSVEDQTINEGDTYTSGDLRDGTIVPSDAKGLWVMLYGECDAAPKTIYIESADDTPDSYSPRMQSQFANQAFPSPFMVRLGTGANAGKIKIKAYSGNWRSIYVWPMGYWT